MITVVSFEERKAIISVCIRKNLARLTILQVYFTTLS